MPRASSRSSSSASASSFAAPASISAAPRGSVSSLDCTSRSASESVTSRCCAPSWRFRSRRRRSAASASTMRERDRRSSSCWRFSSVTSTPWMSLRSSPFSSTIGVTDHDTSRRSPLVVIQRFSCSSPGTSASKASRTAAASSGAANSSQKGRPRACSSSGIPVSCSQKELKRTIAPPGVTTQKMLFAVLTTVLRKSRWRSTSRSARLRSVMSRVIDEHLVLAAPHHSHLAVADRARSRRRACISSVSGCAGRDHAADRLAAAAAASLRRAGGRRSCEPTIRRAAGDSASGRFEWKSTYVPSPRIRNMLSGIAARSARLRRSLARSAWTLRSLTSATRAAARTSSSSSGSSRSAGSWTTTAIGSPSYSSGVTASVAESRRRLDAATLRVDVAAAVLADEQPKRRVVEQAPQRGLRLLERRALARLLQELRRRRPGEPRPQQTREEEEGHGHEADQPDPHDRVAGARHLA